MKSQIAVLIAAGALSLPASALANDSATDAYGGQGNIVSGVSDDSGSGGGSGSAPEVLGVAATQPAASSASPAASAPVAAATPTQAVSSGSLPFTGFDLTLMALGGIALLGLGFGMRRAAARSNTA